MIIAFAFGSQFFVVTVVLRMLTPFGSLGQWVWWTTRHKVTQNRDFSSSATKWTRLANTKLCANSVQGRRALCTWR